MDESQESITLSFKVGDYVDTGSAGYAYIIDVLRSETSERVIICAEFTYNFPNHRGFDDIVIYPDRLFGTDKWVVCDKMEFDKKLLEKIDSIKEKVEKRVAESGNNLAQSA